MVEIVLLKLLVILCRYITFLKRWLFNAMKTT